MPFGAGPACSWTRARSGGQPEPIEEPEPDRLPDETSLSNPDENEEPPIHATELTSGRKR
ncbi:hypothetical protein C7I87_26585 [Mesorhizobium sp. SARCC-RB16n]|uniref:hypothetical protein n=1 Tax=Mesorhizobium sp. SARCC-RB16n TaxID=2116687 RepID=UPI00122EFA93|nr:hypothetical protein C7I87_26585 [Mesorhizobium sp. SARCC-RB16n]